MSSNDRSFQPCHPEMIKRIPQALEEFQRLRKNPREKPSDKAVEFLFEVMLPYINSRLRSNEELCAFLRGYLTGKGYETLKDITSRSFLRELNWIAKTYEDNDKEDSWAYKDAVTLYYELLEISKNTLLFDELPYDEQKVEDALEHYRDVFYATHSIPVPDELVEKQFSKYVKLYQKEEKYDPIITASVPDSADVVEEA